MGRASASVYDDLVYFINLYLREYGKRVDVERRHRFGHAADILEAKRIRKKFEESLRAAYLRIPDPDLASAKSEAKETLIRLGVFKQYSENEFKELVDEALLLAYGDNTAAKSVDERFGPPRMQITRMDIIDPRICYG